MKQNNSGQKIHSNDPRHISSEYYGLNEGWSVVQQYVILDNYNSVIKVLFRKSLIYLL